LETIPPIRGGVAGQRGFVNSGCLETGQSVYRVGAGGTGLGDAPQRLRTGPPTDSRQARIGSVRPTHRSSDQDLGEEFEGYDVSYWSVRRLFVARLGQTSTPPFRRLECAPGEEAQIDFGMAAQPHRT